MVCVVSAITFGMLSAAGGDALTALSENPQVSGETLERLRNVYGLDRPLPERYLTWASAAVRGDMGESFIYRTPVLSLLATRFGNTAMLAIVGMLIALLIAIPFAYLIC